MYFFARMTFVFALVLFPVLMNKGLDLPALSSPAKYGSGPHTIH
jgi:hypothetical protein